MKCSYCSEEMRITTIKEKRPVPVGSKDLNLYDEVTCWQCPKCGQTSKEGLIECDTCHVTTVKCLNAGQVASVANASPVSLKWRTIADQDGKSEYYQCLNCLKCYVCNQPLMTDRKLFQKTLPREVFTAQEWDQMTLFAHMRCVQNKEQGPPAKENNPRAPGFLKKLFGDFF